MSEQKHESCRNISDQRGAVEPSPEQSAISQAFASTLTLIDSRPAFFTNLNIQSSQSLPLIQRSVRYLQLRPVIVKTSIG